MSSRYNVWGIVKAVVVTCRLCRLRTAGLKLIYRETRNVVLGCVHSVWYLLGLVVAILGGPLRVLSRPPKVALSCFVDTSKSRHHLALSSQMICGFEGRRYTHRIVQLGVETRGL